MALTIEHQATFTDRAAMLRLVDTDIHNDLPSLEELRPFLAKKWHPWLVQAILHQYGFRADG